MKFELRMGILIAFVVLSSSIMAISQDREENIRGLYAAAKADEKADHMNLAIEEYQEIIKLNPNLAAAYNNIGRLYYRQGRLQDAIKALERASAIDSKLEAPRALLGFTFFQMGDFEDARRELQSASKLDPADRHSKLFLARSLVKLNDLKGARNILEQLQHEEPDNPEVLYTLGSVYSGLAASTIGRIQTVSPGSYLLEVLLARYSAVKQDYSDAVKHYELAIRKAPNIPGLHYDYAHALWMTGANQKALTEYKQAFALNPYNSQAMWEAARIVLPDDPLTALRLATSALKLNSDIPGALLICGRAYMALGKPKEAIRELQKVISVDPEEASSHFFLAQAYRQAGLRRRAKDEDAIFQHMQAESRQRIQERAQEYVGSHPTGDNTRATPN